MQIWLHHVHAPAVYIILGLDTLCVKTYDKYNPEAPHIPLSSRDFSLTPNPSYSTLPFLPHVKLLGFVIQSGAHTGKGLIPR